MKKIYILFVVMVAIVSSCSPEQPIVNDNHDSADLFGGGPIGGVDDQTDNQDDTDDTFSESVNLVAGQNVVMGSVTVTLEGDTVIVSYTADGDWVIEETHLFVGALEDLPVNGGGNPKIGRFPYKENHPSNTTEVNYTTIELLPGECVWIAAHAVVENSQTGQNETAWGEGEDIGGNSWAMMFEICR